MALHMSTTFFPNFEWETTIILFQSIVLHLINAPAGEVEPSNACGSSLIWSTTRYIF